MPSFLAYKNGSAGVYELPKVLTVVDTFYITRDSIMKEIDTLVIEKVKHKVVYEEVTQRIDTQSVSSDLKFFTEYLQARFPGDYHNDTIKTSE